MVAQEIDFLPAALEIQERPPSPAGRATLWTIMLFFTLSVGWSMLGEIDIVATAHGKIIPSGRVKVIQPMDIGKIRRIHVRDGQRVKTGELLIELDSTASQADVGRLQQERISAQLDAARYVTLMQLMSGAENTGDVSVASPVTPALSLSPELSRQAGRHAVVLQEQMLKSDWTERRSRSDAGVHAIASREAELAALREDVIRLEATLPLISQRAGAVRLMVDRQLSAEHRWLELEQERLEQQQQLAALRQRTRQLEAAIREARQQHRAQDAAFRSELLGRRVDAERRIARLQQESVKAGQRADLQRLIAPVAGVVQQLSVHTIGGVVTPAQDLMTIVPERQSLEVEAWILNKDIGFVEVGQRAEVKIETFNFTRYGTIDAEVTGVSHDAVSDEKHGLVYAGRVVMDRSVIQVADRQVHLAPGMAVTVEVKTGKRRLIEYLLSPLLRYGQESLGER